MLEQFTAQAINVMMLAQTEAKIMGHNFVGPEFLLLGLVQEGRGIAAHALSQCGVGVQNTRTEIEKIVGRGVGPVNVEIPFTPRAKRLLERALTETGAIREVDTADLLRALLHDDQSIAMRVLENLNVKGDQLCAILSDTARQIAIPSYLREIGLYAQINDLEHAHAILNGLNRDLQTMHNMFQRIKLRCDHASRDEFVMLEKRLSELEVALAEQSPILRESIQKVREHLWRTLMQSDV